jgi:alpha-glucosidase
VYEGGQTITYKAPLSVVPVLVKRGSIIPMMPVMQFIGEKKDHPLYLHVYPAEHTNPVAFELYEDDGESQDYLENKFCKTVFECRTSEKYYTLTVSARNSSGFQPSLKRKQVFMLHLAKKPGKVLVDKKPLTTGVSWDAVKGIYSITIPDNGKAHTIELSKH